MSRVEEIRLKKEFDILQAIQKDPRTAKNITIRYNPRADANPSHWVSIKQPPVNGLYPYRFRITYTMPMYVGPDQLVDDWYGSVIFEARPEVLVDPNSQVNVQIDGEFTRGVPFNNHINRGFICSGSAWSVSRGMGIGCFVLCLGMLFNQDPFIMDDRGPHLNGEAFRWWKYQRKMEPNSPIEWPFDLLSGPTKPTFQFGATRKPFRFDPIHK